MTNKITSNNSINSFKIVVIVLAATVLASLFYIYKSSSRNRNTIITLRQEKAVVLKDLEKSKLFLNQIMTTNKSLSEKLILEKKQVTDLILELKTKQVTEKTIVVYKKNVNNIDNRIKLLLQEINIYKNRIDSTNVVLKTEKIKNDTLTLSNKKLVKKVSDAAKLYFYDLKTSFVKIRSSGKQIDTDKASKTDLIKISFMIAKNDFAKSFNKNYYIQIIDPLNNIVGNKQTINFGQESLDFGAKTSIYYDKKTAKVATELQVKDLVTGNYKINIYDKNKLILNSDFKLL